MNWKIGCAAVVALGIGARASEVQAQTAYADQSWFGVMNEVVKACALTDSVHYTGTTSANAEAAMSSGVPSATPIIVAGNQQVAPMTRFLANSAVGCDAFGPDLGDGVTVGLDMVAVVADDSLPQNTCNTLRYSGSIAGYTFDDWRDVLRVVYTGFTTKLPASALDPCNPDAPPRTPSSPGHIPGRCDGPVRTALVANWSEMFEGGCTNGDCPSGLRHAFRRDDASGVTEMFLTLLGLPRATERTFCNGFDQEDLDPIRRACDPKEQVCSHLAYENRHANPDGGQPSAPAVDNQPGQPGDLGLVLPVIMPANPIVQYGPPCQLGSFAYVAMPFASNTTVQQCPDGNLRVLGRCRRPMSGSGDLNCLAVQNTRPPLRTFINMDGRAYNLMPRDRNGGLALSTTGITDPRFGGGGWYRLHQTAPMPNGRGTCQEVDPLRQTGCLVATDPCSIGYGALSTISWNTHGDSLVKGLNVRTPQTPGVAVAPTAANAFLLLDPAGEANGACNGGPGDNFGNRYPLARSLWVNAANGLDFVTDDTTPGGVKNERQLVNCIRNRTNDLMDGALRIGGFITLPQSSQYPLRSCRQ